MKNPHWTVYLFTPLLILFFLQLGCTKPEMNKGKGGMTGEVEESGNDQSRNMEKYPDSLPADVYDIDREMRGEQKPENIEPMEQDTFTVEEVSTDSMKSEEYYLGFRVQVFAASQLSRARSMKKKVVSETGLNAYIEYEDELYKVRVGDYNDRESARDARLSLSNLYPRCWIVRTTINR